MGGHQVAATSTIPTKLGNHTIIITPHRQGQLDQDTVPLCVCVCFRASREEMLAYNGYGTFVHSDPAAAFPPPKPLVYYELKV